MTVRALTWAMNQRVGYRDCKLMLILMADQAGGGDELATWSGSLIDLRLACEIPDERDFSWTLWKLEDLGLIKTVMPGVWRLNTPHPAPVPVKPTRDRGPRVSSALRQRIYERDGHACRECGSTDDLTIDHIHPRVLGGGNEEGNLQTLCRTCNCRKGARV